MKDLNIFIPDSYGLIKTILLILILGSCSSQPEKPVVKNQEILILDTTTSINSLVKEAPVESPPDSFKKPAIDTASLKAKRKYIMANFLEEETPATADYTQLLDLNYDGYKD